MAFIRFYRLLHRKRAAKLQPIQTAKRENAASFYSQRFGFRHAYFRLNPPSFVFFGGFSSAFFSSWNNMYDLVCCVSFSSSRFIHVVLA